MTRRWSSVAHVVAALSGALTFAVSAHAQTAPRTITAALDCSPTQVGELSDAEIGARWMAFHPDRSFGTAQALINSANWDAATNGVFGSARSAAQFAPPNVQAQYTAQLNEADRLFRKLRQTASQDRARFMADSVRPARWQISQNPATGVFVLFSGADQIRITPELTSDQRRGICWPAISISALFARYGEGARDATVTEFGELATQWDNYIENAYSQLPWELLLNSRGQSRRNWAPPRWHWILLHPSAGVEVSGLYRQKLNRVDVVAVEGLGLLHFSADRKHHVGASAVATFSATRPMALGGYLHLWFPQARIGYVVRPDAVKANRASVLATVDLWAFRPDPKRELRAAKVEALAARKRQSGNP